MVVVVIVMPAPMGENNATAQGQDGQQGNQQCDSTQHLKVLMVIAAMKLKLFIGCNMRPRLQPLIPETGYVLGKRLDTNRIHFLQVQEPAMTQSQRLKYSILISLVVLGIMFGLSWLQNTGVISEKMFQYIAIGVAVIVVVINGVMRRKVKP
jgi:hypothetical protein